jgi:hypothetical protein
MPRLLTGIGVFFFTLRIHYGKVAKRPPGFLIDGLHQVCKMRD